MNEPGKNITIGGKIYRMVFNVQALEEVTDRYGGFEQLAELLNSDDREKFLLKHAPWLISVFANQGIALKNYEVGTNDPRITEQEVKLLMPPHQLVNQQLVLTQVINDGLGAGKFADEDAEVDEVLQEVTAGKNVMGAKVE